MALTALKGEESAQRTDVRGGETEARMRAAQKAVDEVERIVMTANGQQRAFYLFARPQKFGFHGFARAYAFAVARVRIMPSARERLHAADCP